MATPMSGIVSCRGTAEGVRLFDWDLWRLGVATADLAYMMAVHWCPDRRRLMEGRDWTAITTSSIANGVTIRPARLSDDYRLSTLWAIVTPVFQAAPTSRP